MRNADQKVVVDDPGRSAIQSLIWTYGTIARAFVAGSSVTGLSRDS